MTIIPRGRALGVTMYLPEEDRLNATEAWALDRIAMAMGGRIAEELVFDELTSGASNDIEQATDLARRMVTEWGMSKALGPLAFGSKQGEIFLGREMAQAADYSAQTAVEIDKEVRRIVTEQYDRARAIIENNRESLDRLADALLEYETLDSTEIDLILGGGTVQRPPTEAPGSSGKKPPDGKKEKKKLLEALEGLAPGKLPEPEKA